MIIFFWKGEGYWTAIGMVATVLVTGILGMLLNVEDATIEVGFLEMLVAIALFIPISLYGRKINAPVVVYNEVTGKEEIIANRHSTFGIPLQYWLYIWPAFITVLFIFFT